MPEPRLIAVITALVLIASTGMSRAAYSLDQLQQIEQLILTKDCGALWDYLATNPTIMEGEDPLARELRGFVAATERGQLTCFAVRSEQAALVSPTPVVPSGTDFGGVRPALGAIY